MGNPKVNNNDILALEAFENFLGHHREGEDIAEQMVSSVDASTTLPAVDDCCKRIGEAVTRMLSSMCHALIAWKRGEMTYDEMAQSVFVMPAYYDGVTVDAFVEFVEKEGDPSLKDAWYHMTWGDEEDDETNSGF